MLNPLRNLSRPTNPAPPACFGLQTTKLSPSSNTLFVIQTPSLFIGLSFALSCSRFLSIRGRITAQPSSGQNKRGLAFDCYPNEPRDRLRYGWLQYRINRLFSRPRWSLFSSAFLNLSPETDSPPLSIPSNVIIIHTKICPTHFHTTPKSSINPQNVSLRPRLPPRLRSLPPRTHPVLSACSPSARPYMGPPEPSWR